MIVVGGSALATHTAFVDAEPQNDVNPARTPHTITAYTSAPGVEVNFNIECDSDPNSAEPAATEAQPECESPNTNSGDPLPTERTSSDMECTTGATTDPNDPAEPNRYSCSVTYTDASSAEGSETDYIRVWSDEETSSAGGDDTYDPGEPSDFVTKTWEHTPQMNCDPETDTNPTSGAGSSHTITCTVQYSHDVDGDGDQDTGPLEGANVDFENESGGAVNDPDSNSSRTTPDRTCTTDAQGQCSVTYPSEGQTGTATIRAWVDVDKNDSTDDSDGTEGRDESTAPGADPEPDHTDVVQKEWAATATVDAQRDTDTNPVGANHTVTAYTNQSGAEVNFNIEDGPNSNDKATNPAEQTSSDFECVTGGSADASGRYSCSWTYQGTRGAGKDLIRVWVDTGTGSSANDDRYQNGEPSDFVEKNWYAQNAQNARLDCEPESATNPTIGPESNHEITCTVTDQNGHPFYKANVDFENESPTVNDPDDNANRTTPDRTCTTAEGPNGDGKCKVEYPGENQAGTATIRAWVDTDHPGTQIAPSNGTDNSDGSETAGTEDSDGTDVVTKTWVAVRLDASPNSDENPVGAEHTITAATSDPGVEVNFNVEEGPHSDDNASNPLDRSTSDYECTTDTDPAGGYTCSWTYAGKAEGTDRIRVWFDEGANDDEFQEGEPNDVVTKTWYTQDAAQSRLNCEPETDTNPAEGSGSAHTIRCTVLDQKGNPFFNANVDFENESPNVNDPDDNANRTNPDKTCTTPASPNGNGQCEVTYNSEGQVGQATIRAWVDRDKNNSTDDADAEESQATEDTDSTDVVTKRWTGDARTIDCAPDTATNPTGTDHIVTCTVLDASGQPVAGEDVTFTSSGVGSVSPTGGKTDQSGRVSTTARSTQPGNQTITGTITDDVSGNEPSEADECDRSAGQPSGAPAGKCADSVTKTWTQARPQCDDDIDNDRDGATDYPADSDCTSAEDTTEGSEPKPQCSDGEDNDGDGRVDGSDPDCDGTEDDNEAHEPQDIDVATNLTIRYDNDANAFKGQSGSSRKKCQVGRVVRLKKIRDGRDRVVGTDTTDRSGNWLIRKDVRRGRFYAVVARKTFIASNGDMINCLRDRSVTIKI